jgi:hypothetical protein
VTPPLAQRRDTPNTRLPTGATSQSRVAAVPETYLTMAGLRERGWTDGMIREYLGEPDDTRANPRYSSAAPMKLYLAERADAAESSPEWAERKVLGARRRAVVMAAADRKRAETKALARQGGQWLPPRVHRFLVASAGAKKSVSSCVTRLCSS